VAEVPSAHTVEFAKDPASVPAARRFVRDAVRSWGLHASEDAAVQLTSELATNSLLHARSSFLVVVSRRPDAVRVEVRDRSVALPRRRSFSTTTTTGRGVRLLDAYGLRWGTQPVNDPPYRKLVWVDVSLEPDSSAQDEYADFDAAVVGMDWLDAEL
jgi:hypothetical protein